MLLPEPFLDGVHLAILLQALDRQHVRAVRLSREHRAGLDRLAVDHHGACAALRRLAADMRAGQAEHLTQIMHEE